MQDEIVSKTRRKQEMHALQALGVALVELAPGQLDRIELPEPLAAAVREAQRITSHEGRRRQLQYIGKLMRSVDAEPIRAALEELQGSAATVRARHRRLEQWRERLLGDDSALTEFAREHAHADLQALRTLIRNARREIAANREPHAQRALFRALRETCP
ncbi:MAG TPA: ribosome biogenesis factor YjgA [Burkholderiales bacterium]|nr:ribosome biogenesis factor YjgA [Burkholderiales bacterium]